MRRSGTERRRETSVAPVVAHRNYTEANAQTSERQACGRTIRTLLPRSGTGPPCRRFRILVRYTFSPIPALRRMLFTPASGDVMSQVGLGTAC